MKKLLFLVLLSAAFNCKATAQEFTKSYGCVRVLTSMGPQAPPAGMATWIEFYDDYILVMGYEKFVYSTTNFDGSMQFLATKSGPPAMNTIGWVVSEDFSSVKQVVQSNMMGMTMQMEYHFNYIGEGSHAAQNLMGAGSSNYGYDDGDDEPITCLSCYGSGACSNCNGSGQYAYSRDGRCGVCRGTGRCAGCNGKGIY